MARGTKRRTKYTWFPTTGTTVIPESFNASGSQFVISVNGSGVPSTLITPLTYDVPAEAGSSVLPDDPGVLAGIVGQEYFIKRIVGKVFAGLQAFRNVNGDPSVPSAALVAVGMFIARANDNDSGGGPNTPIGSASAQELIDNYSPLSNETIREPWIWRRTWILGNKADTFFAQNTAAGAISVGHGQMFPPTTADYGSIQDGPHIDAKCARRVSLDERLYLAVSASPWPLTVIADDDLTVIGYVDYRILAQLRKASARGVF